MNFFSFGMLCLFAMRVVSFYGLEEGGRHSIVSEEEHDGRI